MDVVGTGGTEGPLHRALAEPQRRHLLAVLDAAAAPLGIEELSGAVGLHANTVRWHLRVLEEAGLVRGEALPPVTGTRARGRPRIGWTAVRRAEPAQEYRLLAALLAGSLAGTEDGPARAEEAGRAWGAFLVDRPEPGHRPDAADATQRLLRLLDHHGFAPDAVAAPVAAQDPAPSLLLRSCPYLELAQAHGSVICAAHRGMVEGALVEIGAPLALSRLVPFAEPGVCRLELEAVPSPAPLPAP
jgi:predicted ArsR family transcriptional regulator